jgi:hypothetical protein
VHPTNGQVASINKQYALEAAVKWIIKVGRELMQVFLADRYRPERYYMRGPGPRWRAKHRQEQP